MYFLQPDILKFHPPIVFTKVNSESATLINQKDLCYSAENLGTSCGSRSTFTLADNILFLNEKLILVFLWIKVTNSLGSFPKLRIIFVLSICLAVQMRQFSSHWTDCYEILNIFKKFVKKVYVLLKSDK
jgi:hypothetical protein